MNNEIRQGLRNLAGLLHIAVQIILVFIITGMVGNAEGEDVHQTLVIIQSLLVHLSWMLGVFFIYYAIIRLLGHARERRQPRSG